MLIAETNVAQINNVPTGHSVVGYFIDPGLVKLK